MRDLREGGANCLKYLKRGWNRKEGRRHKDFKRGGGQAGSRRGCLKRKGGGGLGPPYELCHKEILIGALPEPKMGWWMEKRSS